MRIQHIVSCRYDTNDVNVRFMTLLEEHICKYDNIEMVDKAPDLVHICGDWDIHTIRHIKKVIHSETPVIFTSHAGLSFFSSKTRQHQKIMIKKIVRYVSAVHVFGPLEKEMTQSLCPHNKIYVISNPSVSTTTDINKTILQMTEMYNSVISNHDTWKKERIKNKIKVLYSKEDNISAICSRFLYIRYLLNKGYIPIETLKDTASMMTTHQYDEDEMEKLIKKLEIYDFVSSLLYVMHEKANLTEGFMPIQSANNRLSETILNRIIQS